MRGGGREEGEEGRERRREGGRGEGGSEWRGGREERRV